MATRREGFSSVKCSVCGVNGHNARRHERVMAAKITVEIIFRDYAQTHAWGVYRDDEPIEYFKTKREALAAARVLRQEAK